MELSQVHTYLIPFSVFRCKPSSISDAPGARSRFLTWYASLDGALGFFLPLPEKNYRRLLMLQNVMVTHTSHTGGLNPRAFRTYKGMGIQYCVDLAHDF
jgi:Pre-mRNA cleavage and polyadenylation specificity factor